MADINRNEEKVPAPEEIHGLAAALDQFGADFDPYEYMDTVEDKEQNIRDTEAMLLAGKTDGLKNYLMGFIDDSRDPQAVQAAQELMKRLEEIAPQNALRTAEMSMQNVRNCFPNNIPPNYCIADKEYSHLHIFGEMEQTACKEQHRRHKDACKQMLLFSCHKLSSPFMKTPATRDGSRWMAFITP